MNKVFWKRILLIFILFILFVLPFIFTLHMSKIYSDMKIKEIENYNVYVTHEHYDGYVYCPYCGEKLNEE